MKPYAPIPRLVSGNDHRSLLGRVLKADVPADTMRIDAITTSFLRVSLIDTGATPEPVTAEGDTTLHILWQADESAARLEIEGESFPIAPGDTACVPHGDRWQISPHQLAVLVARRAANLALPVSPHHGEESFSSHNRCTSYTQTSMQRWKLTEPLTLPTADKDVVIIGIYADIALQWSAGVDMLTQGSTRVIRPGTGEVILVPNGLSYVLVL